VKEAYARGADAVAFLDDDEVPDPGWLDALLQVQRSSGAQVVSGPVLPRFEDSVPAWVIQGKFFERPRFPTGTPISVARTGNLLLLTKVLKDFDLSFDERFGLSGGEDTLLTLILQRRGVRMVWADEAVVREWIPQDRANWRYILRRAFSGGNNWARVRRLLDPSLWVAFRCSAAAVARIAQGALLLFPSILIGRHALVRSAAKACLGMGMLSGLFGFGSRLYGSPQS
jgi:succinoglycan biosynthesis protein ExoM